MYTIKSLDEALKFLKLINEDMALFVRHFYQRKYQCVLKI